MASDTDEIAALRERIAALEAVVERICSAPMVAIALGAETVIRSSITPAVPEHRPGGSVNKPHPYDEALRKGSKLEALAQELGR